MSDSNQGNEGAVTGGDNGSVVIVPDIWGPPPANDDWDDEDALEAPSRVLNVLDEQVDKINASLDDVDAAAYDIAAITGAFAMDALDSAVTAGQAATMDGDQQAAVQELSAHARQAATAAADFDDALRVMGDQADRICAVMSGEVFTATIAHRDVGDDPDVMTDIGEALGTLATEADTMFVAVEALQRNIGERFQSD